MWRLLSVASYRSRGEKKTKSNEDVSGSSKVVYRFELEEIDGYFFGVGPLRSQGNWPPSTGVNFYPCSSTAILV